MNFYEQAINGVFLFEPFRHFDSRGSFVKTFHQGLATECLQPFDMREEFYSVSRKNVLRGLHFQSPPFQHSKIVYCVSGGILDVVVDIRQGSQSYGRVLSFPLNPENKSVLWIPPGCAHGFLSLKNDSCVIYKTTKEHDAQHDLGIMWDSIDFSWPVDARDVLLSERDQQHPPLSTFQSPFIS